MMPEERAAQVAGKWYDPSFELAGDPIDWEAEKENLVSLIAGAIHTAVADAVAAEREGIIVLLQEILAEGIHTAFRRGGDGSDSTRIWEIITKMDDAEWGGIVSWLAGGLAKAIRSQREGAA